jgi:hypothetical protein
MTTPKFTVIDGGEDDVYVVVPCFGFCEGIISSLDYLPVVG